ncbi:MAG: cyclohydrolase [Gammaproteobacteria bacterium]|jgi:uncharacterized protein YciI|nr:cyclohydrolase [Gammaproteobacteria bacterium]MCE3239294.1 cyclohydrolase [Gammaproteobacteria bacterium]
MPRWFNSFLFKGIPGTKLFIITMNYQDTYCAATISDSLLSAHTKHLQKYFDAERFLAIGNKVDQSGELIIAANLEIEELQGILREDPLYRAGVIETQIVTFLPSMKFSDYHQKNLIEEAHELLLISLNYREPINETLVKIDRQIPEHREFLEKNYQSELFLASGRKDPRTGGIILSLVPTSKKIEEVLDEDPFAINALADREITRVRIGR